VDQESNDFHRIFVCHRCVGLSWWWKVLCFGKTPSPLPALMYRPIHTCCDIENVRPQSVFWLIYREIFHSLLLFLFASQLTFFCDNTEFVIFQEDHKMADFCHRLPPYKISLLEINEGVIILALALLPGYSPSTWVLHLFALGLNILDYLFPFSSLYFGSCFMETCFICKNR